MINPGDTAFVLISAALVMLMTAPGLAFFYGGLVRRKNVLSTMMQSFFLLCLLSVQWVLFGYSLAFGPDIGAFIGSLSWIGFTWRRHGAEPRLCRHHSASAFCRFPDDVRGHHSGAHYRRICRTHEVHPPLPFSACSGRPLSMIRFVTGSGGRRLAQDLWRARFCGRDRGARLLGSISARCRAHARPEKGLPLRTDSPA